MRRQPPARFVSILLLAGTSLVSACSTGTRAARMEEEEYYVYDAVIKKTYLGDEVKRVVIQSETEIEPYHRPNLDAAKESRTISEGFQAFGLRADTVADYFARNEDVFPLRNRFTLPVPVIVLSVREIQTLSAKSGGPDRFWLDFSLKYPNSPPGIIAFSRVGFDPPMDQAFVYARNACGMTCGVGQYYFLTKKNGFWHVELAHQIWVS